jgi:hypothetical protein
MIFTGTLVSLSGAVLFMIFLAVNDIALNLVNVGLTCGSLLCLILGGFIMGLD